jgi:Tol biopolymer transport system component
MPVPGGGRRITLVLLPTSTRPLRAAVPLLLALATAPAASAAAPELLTVPVTGDHPTAPTTLPAQQAVSADGSRVVFSSLASNLDDADASKVSDVFVRDRTAGQTLRVSATAAGKEPDGASGMPALSADGRWVAFLTKATDLGLPTGASTHFDLVERDLSKEPGDAGAFRLIALDVASTLSMQPSISADGDRIAFTTIDNRTASDSDFAPDVYLHDVSAGTTTLASVGDGVAASQPSLSADGTAVAFLTAAAIRPEDHNTVRDAYIRDLSAGTTILASPGLSNADVIGDQLSLSADGERLAFSTTAPLVGDDRNAGRDIYVRDRNAGTTTRISVGGANRQTAPGADAPVVSADAVRVAFSSPAADVVPERGRGFVRLRDLARTVAPEEVDGRPAISGDGETVVYERIVGGSATRSELWAQATEPDLSDTTPPTLVVPGDLTFPATYLRGRHVRFTERATDSGSGLTGTSCDPASGDSFPVGTTTVTCVAADAAGNETVRTFTITVVDKVAPRLSVPTSVTLAAPDGGQTPLDTLIKAIDDVDGAAPTPTCTPAAGTMLAIGTTTVNCEVTDSAGNRAAASYPVHVVGSESVPAAAAATVVTSERARSVAVQLTLAAPVASATDVAVTVAGTTATAGQDFDPSDRTLTIPAGRRAASISIPLTDDQRPEDEEAFTVTFAADGPRPAATSTVTIRDDDGPHEDRRRKDVGPMLWVDDAGHRLMLLEGNATEPIVLATERTEIISDPDVSPDGREVIYFAGGVLKRRPIAGGKAEVIDGVHDIHANHPLWRPDGDAIIFFGHEGPATWATVVSLTDDREPITYGVPNMTGDTFSWNPGGTQLAMVESTDERNDPVIWDKADLAVMDADTGEVVRRFPTPDKESMPEWSPDGTRIAFLRQARIEGGRANRWAGETVSVLDLATGKVTDLTAPADTASGSSYGAPTWSADSRAISFVDRDTRRGTGRPYRIVTMSAAGGPLSTRYDFADPDRQEFVPDLGMLEWAGLAADGPTEEGRIVFTRRAASGEGARLMSVRPTGEDERVVADLGTANASPSVSADGTWLAFASTRDRPDGEIYVATPGGRAIERITDNLVPDSQPAMSADGRRVAFVRGTGTGREIWVHDRESGEEERVVAAGDSGVSDPTFEPGADAIAYVKEGDVPEIREIGLDGSGDRRLTDGRAPAFDRRASRLAFQRAVGDGAPQIYVADPTGLGAEQLTEQPGGATHPSFGPDDRSIAYGTRFGIAMTTTDGGVPIVATQEDTDGEPTWVRPALPPGLKAHDVAITEGTGGTTPAGVLLSIDRPIDDPVTVKFQTADGTAKAPRDYAPRGPDAITIPAGEVTTTVPVDIQADAMDEPDEELAATLTDATAATITRATATIGVRDDDEPPALRVTGVRMPEGDLGDTDAVFQLELSAESGWTVGVHAQTAHGTTDDDDLTPTSSEVRFEPGTTVQEVRVPIHGDTQNEPDETFRLELSGQSHVTGPAGPATGTLVNDDEIGKLPDTGIASGPGKLIRTPTPTFGFIGSVPRGRFECRTDDLPWAPCTTPFRIRAVADGAHTFAVRAFDGELVDPSPATYAFAVDTVAPATTIIGGPPRISAVRQPTFRLRADDPEAHFQCRLDAGDWFDCPATWQAPVLADGNHAFAARAVDPAGNVDPTPAALAFRLDSRAPETFWTQPGQALTDTTPTSSAASLGLSAGAQPKLTLSPDGVTQVPITCSPAAPTPCAGQVTVEELPGGTKQATTTASRAAAPVGAVLGRTSYLVPPGTTEPVALRLSATARHKVERKGTVRARAVITQGNGTAAPVGVLLAADPAAPRLLDAGLRVRVGADGRTVVVRVRCPKAVLPATAAGRSAKAAAAAKARAACRGTAKLRVDGATASARTRMRGAPGRLVHLRLRLPRTAARRVANTATTPAALRLAWGPAPQATKTLDLTLTRGAAR